MEAALISAAGLVWLQDDPYAKSIAIGIVMGSLLHLCSVRSIHLPLGARRDGDRRRGGPLLQHAALGKPWQPCRPCRIERDRRGLPSATRRRR
jgi:hypothetical protein